MSTETAWQPIETAPKDGHLLGARRGRVAIIWWNNQSYSAKPDPYWDGTDAAIFGKRWAKQTQPTHWMPLPALPVAP